MPPLRPPIFDRLVSLELRRPPPASQRAETIEKRGTQWGHRFDVHGARERSREIGNGSGEIGKGSERSDPEIGNGIEREDQSAASAATAASCSECQRFILRLIISFLTIPTRSIISLPVR